MDTYRKNDRKKYRANYNHVFQKDKHRKAVEEHFLGMLQKKYNGYKKRHILILGSSETALNTPKNKPFSDGGGMNNG